MRLHVHIHLLHLNAPVAVQRLRQAAKLSKDARPWFVFDGLARCARRRPRMQPARPLRIGWAWLCETIRLQPALQPD